MELYLVRHGKAEAGTPESPGYRDEERCLGREGRDAVDRVAKLLADAGVAVDRIESSPLRRAVETAEILSRHLNASVRETPRLKPTGDVDDVREHLLDVRGDESVMLVGHNPLMEELSGLLLAEDRDRALLTFHAGSVARLISVDSSSWRFRCDWLLSPSLLE